jgi:predicted nucleotidyltransferase
MLCRPAGSRTVFVYNKDEWESLRKQGRFHSTVIQEIIWVYVKDAEPHDIEHRDAMHTANSLKERRSAYANLLKVSISRIVDTLSALEEVEKVSLFGSYTRGKVDLFTDLDVLVIMKTDMSFPDRLRVLYSKLALPVDLDLLCYTPDEWENLRDRPFFRAALQEEMVLHEKKRS